MSESNLSEQVAAAEAYEKALVPALLEEWSPRVVKAAHLKDGDRVLDVGCGTGVLARYAADAVKPSGFISGVDPGEGMLAVAARLAPDIEWKQGVAESLPYPDNSFDVIVSQFVLMFCTDQQKAIKEMLRVLKPGGRLAVAVWGLLEDAPAYVAEVDLLSRTVGDKAADAIRVPFTLGDRNVLEALFRGVGLTPTVSTHDGHVNYPSVNAMVGPDITGWLPVFGVTLTQSQVDLVLSQADGAMSPFTGSDGKVSFGCKGHIVTAITATRAE